MATKTTKIKLGQRPKNFKTTVEFALLDGGTGAIDITYKYRTRKEWGAFVDSIVASTKQEATDDVAAPADVVVGDVVDAVQTPAPTEPAVALEHLLVDPADAALAFSMEKMMERACAANVRYLLDVIDGWDLDGAVNEETLDGLADMYPGAAAAIMEKYASACRDGRLGN